MLSFQQRYLQASPDFVPRWFNSGIATVHCQIELSAHPFAQAHAFLGWQEVGRIGMRRRVDDAGRALIKQARTIERQELQTFIAKPRGGSGGCQAAQQSVASIA